MPRESKTAKAERAWKVYQALHRTYPDARCSLDFENALQLVVATILAAQCTDQRVNVVTKDLFAKYPTVQAFADAPRERFEQDIRSTGFFRNKASNIRAAARRMIDEHGGEVPDTMDALLNLPGVARKTANVVLGSWFGKNEGIVVDTHVTRLSGRLGFSKHADPVKIERDLMELIPQSDWTMFAHVLVFHGRQCCTARKPDCTNCPVNELCPSACRCDGKPSQKRKTGRSR